MMLRATATSIVSPASWPKLSLIFLNSSRSRNSTATVRLVRPAGQRRLDAVAEQSPVGQVGQASCSAACSRIFSVLRRLSHRRGSRAERHSRQAVHGRRDDPDLATEWVGETLLGLAVGEERRSGSLWQRRQHRPGDRDGWSSQQPAQRVVGRRSGRWRRQRRRRRGSEDRPPQGPVGTRSPHHLGGARSSSPGASSAPPPRGLAQRRAAARLTGRCSVTLRDSRPGGNKFTPSRPG